MGNKNKTCIVCGKFNPRSLHKTCSLQCDLERKKTSQKQYKSSKQVIKTNKNTSAKFSKEIKGKIMIRDGRCIFCGKEIQDIHHIYFGTQANYSENRNDINQGVGVCRTCHNEIHGCSKGEGKRQGAIEYLKKL